MAWRAPSQDDALRHDPAEVFAAGLRNHHISNTAYPIAHARTWRPYKLPPSAVEEAVLRAWEDIEQLGLYVHVPFCQTRCSFCAYTVVKTEEHAGAEAYLRDLLAEFDLYKDRIGTGAKTLRGFDIGGGTPAFVPAGHIEQIIARASRSFALGSDADISIETTPKLAAAEPEKLKAYRRAGVGRISMGIQVIQPALLAMLDRQANGASEHLRAVANIRAAGFSRFNVDLMYGFAGQSPASWEATLRHAIGLAPEYITLYRMRYKLTRVWRQAAKVGLEHVRPLATLSKELLSAAGYLAPPGKTTYSRLPDDGGTSKYLERRVIDGLPYLGLGLGAQSFTHTSISYNDGAAGKDLAPYARSLARGRLPIQDFYDLPARQMMAKMCAVSFYFGEIDRAAFQAKFGVTLEAAFPAEVRFLLSRGLMALTPRALSLTPHGALDINGVIALFFAPSVQRYLLERDRQPAYV